MADDKKDVEAGENGFKKPMELPSLPKSLILEEKKYLLAVERGDIANVRRMVQRAHRKKTIDVNCLDSLGRGALTLAIEGENLEMVELLVVMGVQTRDALLQAIHSEFVEAVELLLEHEELIHKEGEPYSWQRVDPNIAQFTPDITPLTLAAHRNNYEIIKILLDRGATLPMPHDIKCGCDDCIRQSSEDSLRHSLSRVNEYRALASPSLIALSSPDPLLTAFQLSWELRTLAFAEQECKSEYLMLRQQCQQFAVDLLDQSRSSQELAIILNHDPDDPPYEDGEHMNLARLELAINYKQKKFVAHPNIQQLLAAIWYEGVPGFRRKTASEKIMIIMRVALLFPFYCSLYMVLPNCSTGKLMRKPFMKFLIHASSYLFFLLILILVSLRADVQMIHLFGTESMKKALEEELLRQRGNGPTYLELFVFIYVIGFIWEETHEIYLEGIQSYLRNMWNFIDFTRNSLYVAVAVLRVAAYLQQASEISANPGTAYIPREDWDAFDPQLIAEGLFAAANIFSALKLVHLFSINPHLGPLQISLGRMVIDIVKFFFIYSLVLFAFACGLNQLLWYFAELEKRKCYVLPGGLPDWDNAGDSCMKWRSFGNVFEASQSLFWASFGMVGLENFELAGIKSYTRFWGLLMFGSYSVINVIVLLNLLIAMMSNSYAEIDEHSDTEWKFARTRLWMSYFEQGATLPPPFNIFPTPKLLFKILGLRAKDKLNRMNSKIRDKEERDQGLRYTAVMRALVWRYVSAMHRKCDEEPVTEDDINEVKGDISSMRYEMLEVFEKNGMDVSFLDRKDKAILGKRMKVWERRLMKDFQVAPVNMEEEEPVEATTAPEGEKSLDRFRRVARLAASTSSSSKWGQIMQGVCISSQIGRCRSRESFKNQQNLQRAMEEARRLVLRSPLPGGSRCTSPVLLPETTASNLLQLIKDMEEEVGPTTPLPERPSLPWAPGKNLSVNPNKASSRTVTPTKPSGICSPPSSARSIGPSPITSPKSILKPTSTVTSPKIPSPKKPAEEVKSSSKPCEGVTSPKSTSSSLDSGENKSVDGISVDGSKLDEPMPLGAVVRGGGESPPRVVKRKAPMPQGEAPPTNLPPSPAQSPPRAFSPPITVSPPRPFSPPITVSPPRPFTPPITVSPPSLPRPVAPEIHAPEGALPPPPPNPKKTEVQPALPKVEVTPVQVVVKPAEPPTILTPPPTSPEPLEEEWGRLGSSSSTEQLLPDPLPPPCLSPPPSVSSPPSPLMAARHVPEVSTIRRQPKTGWL